MNFSRISLLIKFFVLGISLYWTQKFCEEKTEGFTLLKIGSNRPYNGEWEVKNPPLNKNIFNQRFTFLGTGGQCYAFASEDGKYVLKLFKHHLRRVPFWLEHCPLPKKWSLKRETQRTKRKNKLIRDFTSYKIALEFLPEETGLLYVHLNQTKDLKQKVRLIDPIGIEHSIDLDRTDFLLQKKASLAYVYLDQLINEGRFEEAKEAIESLCQLVIHRCEKGIYDEDAKIHRNFGFIEGKAILIDIGRLRLDPTRKTQSIQYKDLLDITHRLKGYLKEKAPSLAEELEQYLEKRIHV